ncbi:NAD(P)/FAD-dependent oxidoreductase [Sulfurimonas sp. HSL-1716]|uniref:NAD(P)/FAD-dependent oxidoreductase n=1 Tax=Hydrocurvibacter sulfurireducens TaxID=3131937 RepID=UPI0031F8317D
MKRYDVIVIGSGAAGMIAAIKAAREKKRVLLLEKLSKLGSKLKATGGGRCNLTNTLGNEDFMAKFGRNGRFMQDALNLFGHKELIEFFNDIGVKTHAPDGFRVFPVGHDSQTVLFALQNELEHLHVEVRTSQKVIEILSEDLQIKGVKSRSDIYFSPNVIIATGGLGYPVLGAEGDGYALASSLGHKTTELYPAMMPLTTKEKWTNNCRADTLAKVELRVDLKKYKNLKALGDLIFTKNGIRGPVVLDFAREITPILSKLGEVPIVANFTKGMNEDEILRHFKNESVKDPDSTIEQNLLSILPSSVIHELCRLADVDPSMRFNKTEGKNRARLIKILAATPLTVNGHEGFKTAMITRGGISLKEIDPRTMQSRLVKGLYFCGEVIDIDGPCGGYNLQWSFSSGYLAGSLLS